MQTTAGTLFDGTVSRVALIHLLNVGLVVYVQATSLDYDDDDDDELFGNGTGITGSNSTTP